ncbi:MAG: hypothetical protein JWR61_5211 [Ferruginibacter sp.]|nr:hypothetical protein [Ferruginibacter sp.]
MKRKLFNGGIKKPHISVRSLWEHTGSNRGPSACKADALNQLSYAPFTVFSDGKDKGKMFVPKFFSLLILFFLQNGYSCLFNEAISVR